jgi:glycosyltransferase involved in cell wall biosynthesis
MLEIVHLTKQYPPYYGGIPNYVQLVSEELTRQHHVTVLTSNTNFSRKEEVEGLLRVIRLPRLAELRSTSLCPTLPWELSRLHADVVHLHFPDPMAHLAFRLARPRGKLVVSWHADITRQSLLLRLYRGFLSGVFRRADAIVVGAPTFREGSMLLGASRHRCKVIPYGIAIQRFDVTPDVQARISDLRQRYGERGILFVGRLVHYKGVEYLLQAMRGLDARLFVIGDGPLGTRLRQQAIEPGIRGKVEFLGEVSPGELVAHLHSCMMLVLPSVNRSESFGIVQLEAMACRKPVVSTNLPTGVPWVNQDGRTGLVVPPRDVAALRSAIQRLLDNPDLRRQYGEKGRERVVSEFTIELHAHRMLSLYEDLVNGSARL